MAEDPPDPDWFWGTEILKKYPSGVDLTQLEERLKLTPTERLERMIRFQRFLDEAKKGGGGRVPPADR